MSEYNYQHRYGVDRDDVDRSTLTGIFCHVVRLYNHANPHFVRLVQSSLTKSCYFCVYVITLLAVLVVN